MGEAATPSRWERPRIGSPILALLAGLACALPASGQYADTLVDHSPVGGGQAENVLGPPDMQWADFDEVDPMTPGFVVVGFSDLLIQDREGDDVVVHLRDWVGDREWFELFASYDGSNYYSLGESGPPRGEPQEPYTVYFDLATAGLSRARYVKLVNGTIDPDAPLEGPEVDAFEALCYAPAGPGSLSGTVIDAVSGAPVEGAEVTVPGQDPRQTDRSGQFTFGDVPAGETTISVAKQGYYPVSEDVMVSGDSATFVQILMTPRIGFGVVEVRGNYCGPGQRTYYLDGVRLTETFTARIDWEGHPPGRVCWITPYGPYVDDCPGETVQRSFDMGSDFGLGGTLTVMAVTGDDPPEASLPYVVNFKVIPVPVGILARLLYPVPAGNALKYATARINVDPSAIEEGVEQGVIPEDIPLFGNEAFKFVSMFDFAVEVNGNGTASGPSVSPELPGDEGKTRLAGFKFAPTASGQVGWTFCENPDRWEPWGAIQLGATIGADVPPNPIYIIFMVGPIPVPVYFRGHVDVGFAVELQITGWDSPGEAVFDGTLLLDPFPYAEAMAGVGAADVLAIEGYLGGGARMTLNYPYVPPEPVLEQLQVYLAGGLRIVIFIFQAEWPLLEYTWDVYGGFGGLEPGKPILRIIPRDYLTAPGGYAVFVANRSHWDDPNEPTVEIPIQENVFDQSTPDLAALGNDLLLAWVYDDPNRTPINRTEIVFSKYDGTTGLWSEPNAVADDGTADFHPQLAALADGSALLAWENLSEVLEEPNDPNDPNQVTAKLEELKSKTEIAVARYDGATGTWGPQTILTDNAIFDRSPRIATAADGTAMLVWVSNAANHEIGDPNHPNTIHYATYDGTRWSEPADVASGVASIVKSALAYKEGGAILLFTGDTDGELNTPEDRELFAVEYTAGSWRPAVQLTNDPTDPNDPNAAGIQDANPQVAYDNNGEPVVVWYRGGDIVMANEWPPDPNAPSQTIVDLDGPSSGAADFRLARGANGQIALIWQEASEDRVDMWYATYEPTLGLWSQPLRFTADGSMEYAMAPVYDAAGRLFVAYNKVQVEYETRTVEVNGEPVEIDNVPVPAQSDLYVLRHIVSGDLGIGTEDIALDPPNPLPGTEATITATVHNLGDVPAQNIQVAFYHTDPTDPNMLIGTSAITGPLPGGEQADATVSWLVPPSVEPRDLYVVVDPNQVQEDHDRTNNSASIQVLAPDLTISEIGVQSAGPDRLLTIRVANLGVLPVTDVVVTLRKNKPDGALLAAFVVPELVPGAYYDLSYRWESPPPLLSGARMVYAIADETDAVAEFDETNNTRSALVPVKRFDAEPLAPPAEPSQALPRP